MDKEITHIPISIYIASLNEKSNIIDSYKFLSSENDKLKLELKEAYEYIKILTNKRRTIF